MQATCGTPVTDVPQVRVEEIEVSVALPECVVLNALANQSERYSP